MGLSGSGRAVSQDRNPRWSSGCCYANVTLLTLDDPFICQVPFVTSAPLVPLAPDRWSQRPRPPGHHLPSIQKSPRRSPGTPKRSCRRSPRTSAPPDVADQQARGKHAEHGPIAGMVDMGLTPAPRLPPVELAPTARDDDAEAGHATLSSPHAGNPDADVAFLTSQHATPGAGIHGPGPRMRTSRRPAVSTGGACPWTDPGPARRAGPTVLSRTKR
jgi:hypothetical protein